MEYPNFVPSGFLWTYEPFAAMLQCVITVMPQISASLINAPSNKRPHPPSFFKSGRLFEFWIIFV